MTLHVYRDVSALVYSPEPAAAVLVYDAVTCGRSEMDVKKRMWVKSKDWLPNDVEAFYQVQSGSFV